MKTADGPPTPLLTPASDIQRDVTFLVKGFYPIIISSSLWWIISHLPEYPFPLKPSMPGSSAQIQGSCPNLGQKEEVQNCTLYTFMTVAPDATPLGLKAYVSCGFIPSSVDCFQEEDHLLSATCIQQDLPRISGSIPGKLSEREKQLLL